ALTEGAGAVGAARGRRAGRTAGRGRRPGGGLGGRGGGDARAVAGAAGVVAAGAAQRERADTGAGGALAAGPLPVHGDDESTDLAGLASAIDRGPGSKWRLGAGRSAEQPRPQAAALRLLQQPLGLLADRRRRLGADHRVLDLAAVNQEQGRQRADVE